MVVLKILKHDQRKVGGDKKNKHKRGVMINDTGLAPGHSSTRVCPDVREAGRADKLEESFIEPFKQVIVRSG